MCVYVYVRFNPLALEWLQVVGDYEKWIGWLQSSAGGAEQSWQVCACIHAIVCVFVCVAMEFVGVCSM